MFTSWFIKPLVQANTFLPFSLFELLINELILHKTNDECISLTWLNTVKRNGVLADKPITYEVIILYYKPHQSQVRKVDVKLKGFVEYWVKTCRDTEKKFI